jgi:hypothetical protein
MKTNPHQGRLVLLVLLIATATAGCSRQQESQATPVVEATATETDAGTAAALRETAKDAYIYGFPMVDNYRILYSYFVDTANPEYKGPWNQPHNIARVYTPEDKAIQTPNSDTPYTFLGADLRTEPLVISVPAVARSRYYSLQFIDLFTHNFAYVGSRSTGTEAGNYLLAGPGWKGDTPPGIDKVLRSETELAFVLYRTQLFGADDIENVKEIQAQYKVQPLSGFLGTAAPTAAPPIDFRKPLSAEAQRTSIEFFGLLNFLLQFAPPHASEEALLDRFAKIGIGAGKPFDAGAMNATTRAAYEQGMADAWKEQARFKTEQLDTGKLSSADGFGTREFLRNDYIKRMSAAALGIYGNSKEEAMYPAYFVDSDGKPLQGSHAYSLRFAPGQLPPVNSFWSITLYGLPHSLLVENSLDRYLINSTMVDDLVRDADGGITINIQNASPGKAREPNWLPSPEGPFFVIMREYWPKPEALDGTWKAPPMKRTEPATP